MTPATASPTSPEPHEAQAGCTPQPWSRNRVELTVRVVERGTLRYTPAGVPMLDARLQHLSECREAGKPRRVELEVGAVFAGEVAAAAAGLALGSELQARGFLAPRRKSSRTLILHVTEFETIEV